MYIDSFHATGCSPHHQHIDEIPIPLLSITICLERVTLALLGYSIGLPALLPPASLDSLYALGELVASKFLVCYPLLCPLVSFLQQLTIGLLIMRSSKPLALNA